MRMRQTWLFVAALLSGCGGGGSDGPSSTNNTPVSVSKAAGDGQSGVVGANLASPPIVKVLNFNGGGVSGVLVTFTASGGDVLGTTSATTGADGTASAGSWKLGTVAGTHTVTASASGVALPASFTATATADVAKTLAITVGDAQIGTLGSNVAVPPSVKLSDIHGNGVNASTITFAVLTGGGSVTGGTVATSAGGIASVGSWRLGPTPGPNTLRASSTVAGVAPVTFTATAQTDPCTTITPVAVGATVTGTLNTTDCVFAAEYYADLYSFTSAAGALRQLDMSSTAFDPWIDMGSVTDTNAYYAGNDNGGGGTSARLRILTSPGDLLAIANSSAERQTGAYTFGVSAWSGDVAACESTVWLVPGPAVFPQTLAATDCALTGGFLADGIFFFGEPGRTYTITMASAAFDPVLRLVNGQTATVIQTDDNSGGGTTARIVWSPTTFTLGAVFLTAAVTATSGAYTISVTQSGTGAAALSLPPGRAHAIRLPASGGAGAPSVSMQELARRSAPAVRQP